MTSVKPPRSVPPSTAHYIPVRSTKPLTIPKEFNFSKRTHPMKTRSSLLGNPTDLNTSRSFSTSKSYNSTKSGTKAAATTTMKSYNSVQSKSKSNEKISAKVIHLRSVY